jgi:hypothetical protein
MIGRTQVVAVAGMLALGTVLGLGTARADVEDFTYGGPYSTGINMLLNGTTVQSLAGGSIDGSLLNGQQLPYVYCVDIPDTVVEGADYPQTIVTNNGYVNYDGTGEAAQTSPLPNAGEVAWLLDTYGTAGQGPAAMALQAAIWTAIYSDTSNTYTNGESFVLDPDSSVNSQTLINDYNADIAGLTTEIGNAGGAAALNNNAQLLATVRWISPNDGSITVYQGLVTAAPEPTAIFLLCIFMSILGLAGLATRKSA